MRKLNVTVWDETEGPLGPYPNGIYKAIADFLEASGEFGRVYTAAQPQPEHGLTDELLENTDVLVWWSHLYHGDVDDTVVEKVRKRVMDGMGLLVLHSSHAAKIFCRLLGTDPGVLSWREDDEMERVWVIDANHPITHGLPEYFDIPKSEMYGEPFGIPAPDELLFISWHEGGEVFRSGCTFKRGNGKIFYFAPGHEAFPIYHMPIIQQIIINGVKWAASPKFESKGPRHVTTSPETHRKSKG